MRYQISIVDKIPCVAYSDNEYGEPVRVTCHWPIGIGADMARDHVGKQVYAGYIGTGRFVLSLGLGRHIDLVLVDGGKTLPVRTDREDIPAPKTRCELRYYDGGWQKYLKSKGWVMA